MPTVTNRVTGITYSVTNEGLVAILSSPLLSKAYTYSAPVEPQEVSELKKMRQEIEQVPKKKTKKSFSK